ncbi:MAG: HAMP domain-containing protein [Clostridia bacterium]|nr:HAMP domain-containing protein [Clostridia bacterium]
MFKSIFTKYIVSFMTIILVSFALVSVITGVMITKNSTSERRSMVISSTENVKSYIETKYDASVPDDMILFIYQNKALISDTLALLTSYEQTLRFVVTDTEGNVLLADNLTDTEYPEARIPIEYVNHVIENGSYDDISDVDNMFSKRQIAYAVPLVDRDSSISAIIFTFSDTSSLTQFSGLIIRTVITTMLWVMLIALITVYFISERITSPLKKISNAAKEFSKGNFNIRVPVRGNDEITQLALSFNNMAEALENHEKTRSMFIANISHDLRTPMTSISGFIDSILAGAIPPDKYNYYLNIISTEVKRLSKLVSSLLDISRFEAGEKKLVMTEFDICEMARQILISFEKKIDEKRLDIEFDCDDYNTNVIADKDSIYQILYNICDNAIKFSNDGGKYRISIKQKAKKVFVSVYNEGQGIASDDLPYVFDRFYKSDKSRGLDKTGVGLGLHISQTIIKAHGQEIWAESVFGEYCEFVFTLEKA